jgi:hypothetical protein
MNRRDFVGSAVAAALAPALSRAHIGARGSVAGASQQTFDYYISPSATPSNDGGTNTGSLSHPWSLNALNTQGSTYAGKSVGLIGDQGTYDCLSIYIAANGGSTLGSSNTSGVNDPAFNVASGTSSAQTVIGSCNSSGVYSARLAVLDGGSTSLSQSATVNPGGNCILGTFANGGSLSANGQYVTFDGLVFQNNYYKYMYVGFDNGASATPSSKGIIVQNCWFGGSGTLYNEISEENASNFTIYACIGLLVQNNLFNGAVDDTTDRTTLCEQWTSTGSIFQYNTMISQSGSVGGGLFLKNASNQNNTIRYNYIDCTLSGTNLTGSIVIDDDGTSVAESTDYVYNNIFIGVTPVFNNAILIDNWPNGEHGEYWYNNAFIGVSGESSSGPFWVRDNGPATIWYYNNIAYASGETLGGRGLINSNDGSSAGTGSFALIDYNLYSPMNNGMSAYVADGDNPGFPATLATTISGWQSQLPTAATGRDAHSTTTAPTFVGGTPTYPAQYYQLTSGSAGKGAGSSNGQTSGTAIDMGAWGGTDVNTSQPIAQIGCNWVPP